MGCSEVRLRHSDIKTAGEDLIESESPSIFIEKIDKTAEEDLIASHSKVAIERSLCLGQE